MAQVTFIDRPSLDEFEGRVALSVPEVAEVLGLGRTATYEAVRRGQIPARRLGRRIVVPMPAFLVPRLETLVGVLG